MCYYVIVFVCLVLNRLQLSIHDVHLRVTYDENMAFRSSRAEVF